MSLEEKQLGEQQFKDKLKSTIDEKYNEGVFVGALSVSKIILEKLNDNSKPLAKRINEIKRFCEIPLNKQKKIESLLKKQKMNSNDIKQENV